MARTIGILLAFTLIFSVGWACENSQVDQVSARQGLDEYLNENLNFPNPWMSPYYYNIQSRVPFAGYDNPYEGRVPLNRRPAASGYFAKINPYEDNSQEGRLGFSTLGANLLNAGLFGNLLTPARRPFANLVNRMEACTSPSGDAGHCSSASACTLLSGRPSGSCTLGRVCCINVVTSCGGTVTMNNTYWQSPSTAVTAPSTCTLTVKLNSKLIEQAANPICQIRLDFVSFTTTQPTAGTCTADTFTVGGASTMAPTICGDNAGQHMYLDVPSSATKPSDVQLIFNFATGTNTRSWNIKIAMLPCGASYLAPPDCLQYFTTTSGRVKSFNWQDVATTTTRQLNNQNYKICFRTETLASGSSATQMCVSACTTTTPFVGFFLTGTGTAAVPADPSGTPAAVPAAAAAAGTGTAADSCTYDFLAIVGGFDPVSGVINDRYCGGSLKSTSVCTKMKPFSMNFGTDDTEAAITPAVPPGKPVTQLIDNANTGFCLDYQEK